jgi:serine protease inhibitor
VSFRKPAWWTPSKKVNRAFVYFIRDVPTQAVLFVGQFVGVE